MYGAARWLVRGLLGFFYRSVAVQGQEHVPARGPVLLVAPHPNYMVDAYVIGAVLPRPVAFIAKAPLVRAYGPASWVLRAVSVLPIARRADGPIRRRDLLEAVNGVALALRRGRLLCIFPEGESRPGEAIRPLGRGAARVALEAMNGEDAPPLSVVPVGIHYECADRFRSRVVVSFGAPIDTREFRGTKAAGRAAAARELTALLQTRLEELAAAAPENLPAPAARSGAPAWRFVGALGCALHAIPYLAARSWMQLATRRAEKRAFVQLMASLAAFPLWYLLLLSRLRSRAASFALAVAGPWTAAPALRLIDERAEAGAGEQRDPSHSSADRSLRPY
jgi:1-acyl-sn-glycerol-3-phosphate acyltransferase